MRRLIHLCLIMVLFCCAHGLSARDGACRIEDPAGDDYGPGTYLYPKNKAFEPYKGLFDLLFFAVDYDAREASFEVGLADLRNTWRAPEGFSHQLIEIYIHRGQERGRTEAMVPGAYVKFSPDYPWDVMLKAAPWESSKLVVLDGRGMPVEYPLPVGPAGEKSVRLRAPLAALGVPTAAWRFYVLIGSYDGFGEDNFRPVMAKAGDWHLGGGRDDTWDPNVLDILAPARGRFSQERQLGGFDPERNRMAVLMPMGPGFVPGSGGAPRRLILAAALLVLAVAGWSWYAPPSWRRWAGEIWDGWRRFFMSPAKRAGAP